jgi:hypothetical protein
LNTLQKVGNTIKSGFQKAGGAIKKGFQKAGSAIKKGFQKVGGAIKAGAQKVKQGFQTAGRFIKKYAPVVAKFGLKVISAAQSVAARVVKYIPVIGKPLSEVLKVESKGLNMASNAIHANLPSSLKKGTQVLDDIRDPFGGCRRHSIPSLRVTNSFYIGAAAKAAGKAVGGKPAAAIAQVADQIF